MKIHEAELTNVRHLRHVRLDLSAPITVLSGRNGAAKTTVQQAILLAMFRAKNKEARDGLVSRFDPGTPPQVTLKLSRGEPQPTITLTRTLTDDQGTWTENGQTLRRKGQALEKIQESLPISADSAALLLWGLQEEMAQVLSKFPQEGHALLTAAAVRGTGPDPAEVVRQLRKQFSDAKVAGTKNQGTLTLARRKVELLAEEGASAREAQAALRELEEEFGRARSARDTLSACRALLDTQAADTQRLLRLCESVQQAAARHEPIHTRCEHLRTMDNQIRDAQRATDALTDDLRVIQTQLRVARDQQFGEELRRLAAQVATVEQAAAAVEQIERRIEAAVRPGRDDMRKLDELKKQISAATDRIEASGFHYRLSRSEIGGRRSEGETKIEISEDQGATRLVDLASQEVSGIAGRVVLRVGGIEIAASGKEDVASHKRRIEQAAAEIKALLARFAAHDEAALAALANEQERLQGALKDARAELQRHLGATSLLDLRGQQERIESARLQNRATPEDHAACEGRHLASVADLEKRAVAKDKELELSARQLNELRSRRPDEHEMSRLDAALAETLAQLNAARLAFEQADPRGRLASAEVRDELQRQSRSDQEALRGVLEEHATADRKVAELSMSLKYAGPQRQLSAIDADLEEAAADLHREEVLQEARELLAQRIEEQATELAAAVPEALARRISEHLAKISDGAYGRITLTPQLQVVSVGQGRQSADEWRTDQLSTGQRTIAALTLKIAVARALAEMNHPVFIVLDDSFVNLDAPHREATQRLLLDLTADGNLQVILMTCHSDWASTWQQESPERIRWIELEETAQYHGRDDAVPAELSAIG